MLSCNTLNTWALVREEFPLLPEKRFLHFQWEKVMKQNKSAASQKLFFYWGYWILTFISTFTTGAPSKIKDTLSGDVCVCYLKMRLLIRITAKNSQCVPYIWLPRVLYGVYQYQAHSDSNRRSHKNKRNTCFWHWKKNIFGACVVFGI